MRFVTAHLGEAAALGAATCWVFTSLSFAAAGRRIGPTAVNLIRILIAWVFLMAIHRVMFSTWIPQLDSQSLVLLAVSGVIGFAVCDQLAFAAFVDVGARLTTLLMTITPVVAAGLAWLALREPLSAMAMVGMAVTLIGIAWVALERPDSTAKLPHPHRVRGLICGALAGVFQAVGLILSKLGMGHTRLPVSEHLDPWSASLVRVCFGAAAICVLALISRAGRSAIVAGAAAGLETEAEAQAETEAEAEAEAQALAQSRAQLATRSEWPRAIALLTIGAILGPVTGVWFSLVAIDRAEAGIAATLMAMTPVLILPFVAWLERERISGRAIAGAVVAVLGVAILTLHSRLQAWISGAMELIFP